MNSRQDSLLPTLRRILRLLVLAPLFFLPHTPASARDIVIAQSVDISGPLGYIGKDYLTGAKVYFDYVNAHGGINGRKIVHLVEDNASSPAKAEQINRSFLAKQKADVLFGYFGEGSVDTLKGDKSFANSGIPLVAPLSGMDTDRNDGNIFFIRPSYGSEAKKLVGHFLNLGITRFAAVHATDGYGTAALASVEEELKNKRLILLGKHAVTPDGNGLDKAVRATLADKPQAIILILQTLPAVQFIKAYRSQDPGAFIFGLSLINHETLFEIAGREGATGIMISQVVPHPNNKVIPVVAEHEKLMKIYRDEAPSHLTLEGFIAAKFLVSAMKAAGKDFTPSQLAMALKDTRSLDIGGYYLAFSPLQNRGSNYVDINVINRSGKLVN